jgi:hypothetical protein
MRLLPHISPNHFYASEYYKQDFFRYNERLGAENISSRSLVPRLYPPTFIQKSLTMESSSARTGISAMDPFSTRRYLKSRSWREAAMNAGFRWAGAGNQE